MPVPSAVLSDPADDSGTDATSYRLPGLHAESSIDNMSTGPDALPPIGNLSLGKANMAGNQTQRRGVPPAYYDTGTGGINKNKGVPSAAAAAAAAMARRQGMPAQPKYVNKPVPGAAAVGQVAVAGHKMGPVPVGVTDLTASGGGNTYKYKANAVKGSSKYVSPYSLRQLVGKE
jgi:renal tumor antigen